jgi:hypothetical protein
LVFGDFAGDQRGEVLGDGEGDVGAVAGVVSAVSHIYRTKQKKKDQMISMRCKG